MIYGKVFRIGQKPPKGYYKWFEPKNPKLLGYLVNETVFVLINTDESDGQFKNVVLPEGKWQQIADIHRIDLHSEISFDKYNILPGQKRQSIILKPRSLAIWIKK